MPSVPVQTRLAPSLADALDARAKQDGTTRAEVARVLLEAALTPSQPVPTDPLLGQIVDAIGTLLAQSDAILNATRSADARAHAAYATAYLQAQMVLPADQRQAFRDKLAEKLA